MKNQKRERVIYTIGHSTHDLEVFIGLLKSFGVDQVIDIRSIPRSRHNPQFNFDSFPIALRNKGIGYRHEKKLGGLRRPKKDSINMAWENPSFRGFADYMQTKDFLLGLNRVMAIMQKRTLALMCAEALPWRCHRSLIADSLVIRDIEVCDIMDFNKCRLHTLTPWACLHDLNISYPKLNAD